MKVVHKKTGKVIASNLKYAHTFFERLKGLMFLDEMKDMDALLIDRCNAIHNCFVRFSLDVVFLDQDFKVVKIIRNFKPWRFSWMYFSATQVLELEAGDKIDGVLEGDFLEVLGV